MKFALEFGGEPQHVTVGAARLAIAHLGGSRSGRRLFTSRDDAVAWLATMQA